MNAVAITLLCVFGLVTAVQRIVPFEAALGILVWIGIIILAQSYQAVPRKHALAVSLGIIPALAGWALTLIDNTLAQARLAAGDQALNLHDLAQPLTQADIHVHGLIALSQGFLITSMIYAAVLVYIIENKLLRAAIWLAVAAALANVGIIHAYDLTPSGVANKFMSFASFEALSAAPRFALAYLLSAVVMLVLHAAQQNDTAGKPAR